MIILPIIMNNQDISYSPEIKRILSPIKKEIKSPFIMATIMELLLIEVGKKTVLN